MRYTDSTVLISVCHLIHQLFLVLNIVIPPDLQNDLLIFVTADCQEHSILFDMQLLCGGINFLMTLQNHVLFLEQYINLFCVGDYNFSCKCKLYSVYVCCVHVFCIVSILCIYVRMYVCTYVCMYVCVYVRMYVCTYVCMYVCVYVRMYVCISYH